MPNAGQMAKSSQVVVKTVSSLADVPAAAWDRLANPDPATHNPFVSHAFLCTLEAAGTVGGRSGWQPQHLIIEDGGQGSEDWSHIIPRIAARAAEGVRRELERRWERVTAG